MNLIVALLGLCFMNNILAKEYVFEFNVGGDNDNDDELNMLDKEYHDVWGPMDEDEDYEEVYFNLKNNDHSTINAEISNNEDTRANPIKEKVIEKPKKPTDNKDKKKNKEKPIVKRAVVNTETQTKPDYRGESFLEKYLKPDRTEITIEDLNIYLDRLNRSINYFSTLLNQTEVNVGLGLYLSGAILKHCLKTYKNKINKELAENLKYMIKTADNIFSHYAYLNVHMDDEPHAQEYKVVQTLRDDAVLLDSLSVNNFNRGRFEKWIFSVGVQMHNYLREMDEATLPKEKYAELVDDMALYYMSIDESGKNVYHISNVSSNDVKNKMSVVKVSKLTIWGSIVARPLDTARKLSIGNKAIKVNGGTSKKLKDEIVSSTHLDILCSFMYREAVYIARRWFFARDLFLEHIALCGFLGYEEFHRPAWFRKASSWVDDMHCGVQKL